MAIVLLLILCCLQFGIWFSKTGVRNIRSLDQAVLQQQTENADQKLKNEQLEAEVKNLRNELDAVEERARNELGLIAEDETFFQVLEGEDPSKIDRDPDEKAND